MRGHKVEATQLSYEKSRAVVKYLNMENSYLSKEAFGNPKLPKDVSQPPKSITLQSFEDNYQMISSLGNGSFGTVALAKYKKDKHQLLLVESHKLGTLMDPLVDSYPHLSCLVAIKTMKKKLQLLNEATRVKEVKFILTIPSHPGLVQIYDMFIDHTQFHLHIVMESMNQNLYQLMRARKRIRFSPSSLKSILSQLLSAIRHIHKHDYFHRDVKPENILVMPTLQYYGTKENIPPERRGDTYVLKLADYGLARHVRNLRPYTSYVSTRWYRSPEILLRRSWYSKPVDIWAFGTIAVEVANFVPLFPGTGELDQIWRILEVLGSPSAPNCDNVPFSPPLGGYWKEAQLLASRLGFTLPNIDGVQIHNLIPESVSEDLCDVVKACLTWNPDVRADTETLCSMPYFRDTPVAREYEEPERPSARLGAKMQHRSKGSQALVEPLTGKSERSTFNKTFRLPSNSSKSGIMKAQNKILKQVRGLPSSVYNNFGSDEEVSSNIEKNVMRDYAYDALNNSASPQKGSLEYEPDYLQPLNNNENRTPEVIHKKDLNDTPPELAEDYENKSFHFYQMDYGVNDKDTIMAEYESDSAYSKLNAAQYAWGKRAGMDYSNINSRDNESDEETDVSNTATNEEASQKSNNFQQSNARSQSDNSLDRQYFSNNLKIMREPLDDEFGIMADISFGSNHEIKC